MANTAKRLQRLQTSILVTDTGLSSLQTLEQSHEMPKFRNQHCHCPRTALQSLHSSFQLSRIPGDLCPCPEDVGGWQGLPVWFSFLSTCHISATVPSDSLKCFPSVPTSCSDVGISTLVQLPNPPGADWFCSLSSSVSLPSFILPSFAWGSVYSFPMVRDSC